MQLIKKYFNAGFLGGSGGTVSFLPRSSAGGGGGGGTVTSVGLSMPSAVFAVANSPITSSGTLAVTFQNQTANTVFAGPAAGGAAVPTFRTLVAADIPGIPLTAASIGFGSVTNTLTGIPTFVWDNTASRMGINTASPFSSLTVQEDSIGGAPSSTLGISLINGTLATSGNQKYSPSLLFRANGWNTSGAGSSQTLDWRMYVSASQGSPIPTTSLVLGTSINGGAFLERFFFSYGDNGNLIIFQAPNITINGNGMLYTAESGTGNSNLAVFGQTIGTAAASGIVFGGAANVNARSWNAGVLTTLVANASYASHIIAATDITEAASGTHALLASLVIKAQNIIAAGATVTNTATLYVESAMTVSVSGANYAVWVASGISRFDGAVQFATGTATIPSAIFITGTSVTSPTAGMLEYVTPFLSFTNGTAVRQQIPLVQSSRVSTQFDVTNSAVLVNVTGLTANVAAGATYKFTLIIYGACDIVAGIQIAFAGTATATAITYQAIFGEASGFANNSARATALGSGIAVGSGSTAPYVIFTGIITVNTAGTLTVQMAEEVATPATTASLLIGTNFQIQQIL